MYFFNLKALIRDLKNNKVSDGNKFCYYFLSGFLVLCSLFAFPFKILFILFLAHINSCGDNKDFALRYLALRWVVDLRIFTPIFVGLLFLLISATISLGLSIILFIVLAIYTIWALIYSFVMMYRSIKEVSGTRK